MEKWHNEKKVTISLQLPEKLATAVKNIASKRSLSLSAQIRIVLIDYVEDYMKNLRAIEISS